MALLTGRTRAEAAKAIDDTTLWVLYKTEYDDLIVQHPALSLALSRALSTRLGNADGDGAERHLRQLNLFGGLSQTELRQVSQVRAASAAAHRRIHLFCGSTCPVCLYYRGG